MKDEVDSPFGVLEDYFNFKSSESETSSSKEPSTIVDSDKLKPGSRWNAFLQLLRVKSKPIATLHPLSVLKLSRRMSSSMRETVIDADSSLHRSPWKIFTHHEIQIATNYFIQENCIGKGGYAEVYKGCLPNGQLVAIKMLTRGTENETIGDFLSELGIMAHVNHSNTAKLVGYGVEGGMYLVLELSEKGCLASMLNGSKEKLPWSFRQKIALGTAKGIMYLHEGCQRRIIHRDITAANILLTENFEPQAKPLLKKNCIRELIDPSLADDFDCRQIKIMLLAASLCIQQSSIRRPSMKQASSLVLLKFQLNVVQLLNGNLSCFKFTKKSQHPLFRKVFQEELLDAD
ncbi:hypothetical protein JHK85_007750 [Glycine max]|nr:hypothetical protein JHK85_007750 [Glycine max]